MTTNPFGPWITNYCPVCMQYTSSPHYCPGKQQPNIYTWPDPNKEKIVKKLHESIVVPFDPEKESVGTVIFMDGVYYVKSNVESEYDWYNDANEYLNAAIMRGRFKDAKTFEFLKRPRTSKRAVFERFLNHRDIDKALEELKSTLD